MTQNPAPTPDGQHPYDPFAGTSADPAVSASAADAPQATPAPAAPQSPYGTASSADPFAQPAPQQDGFAQAAPPSGGYQQQAPQAGGYAQPAAGAPAGQHPAESPLPAGFAGLYEGTLSGQGTTPSDSRMWSMFAHLSVVLGYIVGAGFLGWVGPLVIFLMYKDRDRFVRYNAAEALNAAIATVIIEIVLAIVLTIFTLITFGIGGFAFPLIWVPAILHGVFAIIGAVKTNQGTWWNYPINIRLVK
ncbi:DUF4870 domain-containing protein [Brachybacterium sp. DNPG3]